MLSNLIILSDLLHHLVHHFHIKLHHFMIQYTTLPFFLILQNTSKYKGLRSYINLWKSIVRKSINSFLYCSITLNPPVLASFSFSTLQSGFQYKNQLISESQSHKVYHRICNFSTRQLSMPDCCPIMADCRVRSHNINCHIMYKITSRSR